MNAQMIGTGCFDHLCFAVFNAAGVGSVDGDLLVLIQGIDAEILTGDSDADAAIIGFRALGSHDSPPDERGCYYYKKKEQFFLFDLHANIHLQSICAFCARESQP